MLTINDLPVELLQSILESAVQCWEHQPGRRWSLLMTFHTSVRLVSRTWYTAVMHTASLWRNIPLHKGYLTYASFCLAHSGSHPLNVQASMYKAFQNLITPERAVRVGRLEVEDKEQDRHWVPLILELPIQALTALSIHSVCSDWAIPLIIFARNPHLRQLDITRFYQWAPYGAQERTHPTLPELRALKINTWAKPAGEHLRSFAAPKLHSLHIAICDEHRYGDRMQPMTLQGMDGLPALKELTFQFAVTTEDVLAVLRHTPGLDVLMLAHSWRFQSSFDDLLVHLANPKAETILVPRLHTLCLHEFPVWMPAILAFVRARLSASAASRDAGAGAGVRVRAMQAVELSPRTVMFYTEADIARLQETVEVRVWEPPPGEVR